jgi:predicted secreted protein
MKKKTPSQLTRRERACLAHVRRAQARKMSLAQYCRAKGLNVQSLYNLRHQLAGKRAMRPKAAAKRLKPASRFVSVQVAAAEAARPGAACRLHLKGCVIECASLPPTAWIAGLMAGDADAVS